MKLVVSIPAYNEEKNIGDVIRSIPRDLADDILIVVIDDGSTDNSIQEAKKAGADRIISHRKNLGLAQAFRRGLEEGLALGADVIVNMDADGQYLGNEIKNLIEPIKKGEADVVLGSRFSGWIEEMPFQKKLGNIIATKVTGFLSGIRISDAQTGFRAFSREAALRINILSDYTYTQESIIQAAHMGLVIKEVPVHFRRRDGRSQLIPNILSYAKKSGTTILRTYRDYRPLHTFTLIGGLVFVGGLIMGIRVLVHYIKTGFVSPYIPSAILTALLLIMGFQVIVLGLIADMIGSNRKILDEILYNAKKSR